MLPGVGEPLFRLRRLQLFPFRLLDGDLGLRLLVFDPLAIMPVPLRPADVAARGTPMLVDLDIADALFYRFDDAVNIDILLDRVEDVVEHAGLAFAAFQGVVDGLQVGAARLTVALALLTRPRPAFRTKHK